MPPLRAVQTAGPAPLARTPGLSAKISMKTSTFAFGTTNLSAAAQDLQFEPLRRRGCTPSMRSRLADLRIAFPTTPPGLRRGRALFGWPRCTSAIGSVLGVEGRHHTIFWASRARPRPPLLGLRCAAVPTAGQRWRREIVNVLFKLRRLLN